MKFRKENILLILLGILVIFMVIKKKDIVEHADFCGEAASQVTKAIADYDEKEEKEVKEWIDKKNSYKDEYNNGKGEYKREIGNADGDKGPNGADDPNYWRAFCLGSGNYIKSITPDYGDNFIQRIYNIKCNKGGSTAQPNSQIGSSESNTKPVLTAPLNGANKIGFAVHSNQTTKRLYGVDFGGKKVETGYYDSTTPFKYETCPSGTIIKGLAGKSYYTKSWARDVPAKIHIYCEPLNYERNGQGEHYANLTDYAVNGKHIGSEYIAKSYPTQELNCQQCVNEIKDVTMEDNKDAYLDQYMKCTQEKGKPPPASPSPSTSSSPPPPSTSSSPPPSSPPTSSSSSSSSPPPSTSSSSPSPSPSPSPAESNTSFYLATGGGTLMSSVSSCICAILIGIIVFMMM